MADCWRDAHRVGRSIRRVWISGLADPASGDENRAILPGTSADPGSESLERALTQVANHPVGSICAGRTDSGVHGIGQVVHFDTTAVRSMRSWVLGGNANLPLDLNVSWACQVPEEFHARFSAAAIAISFSIDHIGRRCGGSERHGATDRSMWNGCTPPARSWSANTISVPFVLRSAKPSIQSGKSAS